MPLKMEKYGWNVRILECKITTDTCTDITLFFKKNYKNSLLLYVIENEDN